MTNAMVLERTSNLVMPSHYIELDIDKMSYVDGGWKWSWGGFLSVIGGVISVAAGIVSIVTGAGTAAGILAFAEVV